ncbi:MAG TPA: gamma-glutamyltransferase [Thermoanaerobaculales bacterium]|nr:gamma-glutamyltransferase [Thermoanaerobaculales bacterium]HQN97442.1 gamma-glutamyltransferase [Thermoanaerobaculales bacterium]HQP42982.1 gamma-glutamyltransferase [Thermoanaerobaculales bacterium]
MIAQRLLSALVLAVALAPGRADAADARAVAGSGGAVSSAELDASRAGLEILEAGGNAVDAAVATALALAVVHPQAGNLGGGGFAVVLVGDRLAALDFRETAPAAARPDMYLDERGRPVPDASLVGPLAAGVPGTPTGLFELHARHGRLPWPKVVDPAIRLAAGGFRVSRRLNADLAEEAALLARFPSSAALWLPAGRPIEAGALVVLPELSSTLRDYATAGPAAITEGRRAVAIAEAAREHGGILTTADLAGYRPVWREPLTFEAFGWQVASMPLPSSGGIIVGQTCGFAERTGWASLPRFGAERAHRLAEAWRRSFADRFDLGDPDHTGFDGAPLLAGRWLDLRAGQLRHRATPSKKVRPWSPRMALERAETTHLSVVDGDGNAVSMTTTLNGSFGCGLTVEGAGFLLNNEMDDFAAAPGQPNLYGLIQGEANAIAPGKRMLSSMSPTVCRRGSELLVLGSPGGPRIPTATAQVLLSIVVDSDELQAAVNRPRIHHQWLPDAIFAEPGALSPETAAELVRRGHQLREIEAIGDVNAVRRWADGAVAAAADPRGGGAAVVQRPAPG